MELQKEYLDLLLVPAGLVIMIGYHIFLIHKRQTNPDGTIIGLEIKDKKDWVTSIVQGEDKATDRAVDVISNNTSAANSLAAISLTLSSIIGTWLGSSNSFTNMFQSGRIFGDTSPFTVFIKSICLLSCLLLAFSCFVQASIRFLHANYMISSPENKRLAKKIQFNVTRGCEFWLFGLRALYFALNMLVWFFGPIPMFVSSIVMVLVLYYHDIYVATQQNIYCTQHNIYCVEDGQTSKTANSRSSFSY